jgi:uncharacterized membrane protein YbhN (UPF0104 family)
LLVPAFGLVLLTAVVRAYRWRMLFLSRPPSAVRLFVVGTTGMGVNSLSPVRVLAEPVQFAYLTVQDGHDRGDVLASLMLIRVTDLFVTLGMIVCGFLVFPPSEAQVPSAVWLSILALMAAAAVITVLSISLPRWEWRQRWPWTAAYAEPWRRLLTSPQRLASVLLMSILQWSLVGTAAWVIARGTGIDLPPLLVPPLTLAVFTLGLSLPGLPTGLGPVEFAATFFFSLYGIAEEPALAFGLIAHAVFLLPSIVIAALTIAVTGLPWRREGGGKDSIPSPLGGEG